MKSILEVVRDLIKPYIDKNANNIAPVEDSTVENPYYVGDQLIYKGVLYNVTADISIGDTLEIGTNISVAPKINSSVKSKLSSYSSDSTVWDTSPTASSTKPVTSGGVYTGLSEKAPTNHASTATTYGVGNASNYGHVKLNDSYTSSGGAASASVGASSKAVVDGYNALNGNKTNQSVIAPRQANNIAIQKYEVGKQFIYNNILYTATAEIAKNGTINPGGNCSTSEDIVSQISKFNQKQIGHAVGATSIPISNYHDVDVACIYTYNGTIYTWLYHIPYIFISQLGSNYRFLRTGDVQSIIILGITSSNVVVNTATFAGTNVIANIDTYVYTT